MRNKKFKFLLFLLAAVASVAFSACKGRPAKETPDQSVPVGAFTKTGSVERLSPKLDDIIPRDEFPEIIAEGFEWTEGPLWLPELDILLFSDIPRNSVFQWSEKDGLKVYLKPSGYTGTSPRGGETGSNGLLLDHQGRLVLCQHGDHSRYVPSEDQTEIERVMAQSAHSQRSTLNAHVSCLTALRYLCPLPSAQINPSLI